MRLIEFSEEQIVERIKLENPWWRKPYKIDEFYGRMKPREYIVLFHKLVQEKEVRRAVVLMGQRRVGKTVLIHHSIQKLLKSKVNPQKIFYISIDTPIYTGMGLEQLFK